MNSTDNVVCALCNREVDSGNATFVPNYSSPNWYKGLDGQWWCKNCQDTKEVE